MIFFSRSEEVSLGLRELAELALGELSGCIAGTLLCLESEINSHQVLVLNILKAGMVSFRNWWWHWYLWNIIIKYEYVLETQTLTVSFLTMFLILLLICQCDERDIWFTIHLKPLVFCLPIHLAKSALVSIILALQPEMPLGNFFIHSNCKKKYCRRTGILYTLSSFFNLPCFFSLP